MNTYMDDWNMFFYAALINLQSQIQTSQVQSFHVDVCRESQKKSWKNPWNCMLVVFMPNLYVILLWICFHSNKIIFD